VVPCIAYNCTKAKYGALFFQGFRPFWKRKNSKKSTFAFRVTLPRGTWFADSIKCLE